MSHSSLRTMSKTPPCGCPAVHHLASAQSSDLVMHTSSCLFPKPRQNWAGHLSRVLTFSCAFAPLPRCSLPIEPLSPLPEWVSPVLLWRTLPVYSASHPPPTSPLPPILRSCWNLNIKKALWKITRLKSVLNINVYSLVDYYKMKLPATTTQVNQSTLMTPQEPPIMPLSGHRLLPPL